MSDIEQRIEKQSPGTGTPLQQITGNYYWSPYEKINYYDNNGTMIPLVSPLTGGPLEITQDGKLFSPYEKQYFAIGDGKWYPQKLYHQELVEKWKKYQTNCILIHMKKLTTMTIMEQ